MLDKMGLFRGGDYISFVITDKDGKGFDVVEPVVGEKIPSIRTNGYIHYWEAIERFINNILGYNIVEKKMDEYS